MSKDSKIILALDFDNPAQVVKTIAATNQYVKVYKLGLEYFLANGPTGVREIQQSFPEVDLFLDLKLHDIPNTVGKAAMALQGIDPRFLTVHASGGAAMIEAATQALPKTSITAVTVLTSLDSRDLVQMGLPGNAMQLAVNLAVNSVNHGARAVVCSPLEVKAIREAVGSEVILITPGVRPKSDGETPAIDDQQRVATPSQAISNGADFVVIGRPITKAADPAAAAQLIFNSMI